MADFVNKFIMVDDGETYRMGVIIESPADRYCVVQFDHVAGGVPCPAELHSLDEMVSVDGAGMKRWTFFASAEARQAWIDWLDGPAEKRVVKLVKQ